MDKRFSRAPDLPGPSSSGRRSVAPESMSAMLGRRAGMTDPSTGRLGHQVGRPRRHGEFPDRTSVTVPPYSCQMPNSPALQDDLALALRLADAADAISLPRFRAADLQVAAKPDLTPVSDADLAVERAIRSILATARPGDAIVGEEFGESAATRVTGRRWVVDPIDGTKNFVRGVPVWATLIALFDGEDVVVGVVSAPALTRRWWAAAGSGSFASFAGGPPRRCRVSGVSDLADASLSYSELAEWRLAGRAPAFAQLAEG